MAVTKVRGNTQIIDDTILNAQINSAAGIATTKLAQGPNFIQKDGSVAYTADQPMGGFKLTGLGSPVSNTDGANKQYVDNVAQGLDIKESVRACTTAAIPNLSNASVVHDGVTLVQGDRILVAKDASPDGIVTVGGEYNGIYVVGVVATGTAPFTRALDADSSAEVTAGMFTFVTEGTAHADAGFVLATDNPITLDTTVLLFTQFTGTGQITAGDGLTKTGSIIDVVAGNGIAVAANSVSVNLDGGTLTVGVAGLKLTDLTSGSILVGNGSNVATGVAMTGDIAIDNTGATSINSGVIVNGDINTNAAIALSKLAAGAAGQIIVGAATTGVPTYVAMSGDVVIDNAGVTSISSGVIVNADINASADIALSKLVAGAAGQIIVGAVTTGIPTYVNMTGDVVIDNAGVTSISSGVIVDADINASAAISLSKLAAGTSAQMIVANASGVPTYVTISGDVTISNTGVATVNGAAIQDNFVTREVPTGSINSSNTTFTLANTPQVGTEHVYLNGLLQEVGASADYQIAAGVITYNTAPVTGDKMNVSYIK